MASGEEALTLKGEVSSIGEAFLVDQAPTTSPQELLSNEALDAQEKLIEAILKEPESSTASKMPETGKQKTTPKVQVPETGPQNGEPCRLKESPTGENTERDDPTDCLLAGYRLPNKPGTAVPFSRVVSSWGKKPKLETPFVDRVVSSKEGMAEAKAKFASLITGSNSVKAVDSIWEECAPKTIQLNTFINEPAPGTKLGYRSTRVDIPKEKIISLLTNKGYEAEWVTRRAKGRMDVLLRSQEQAAKMALGGTLSEGAIRLYPEYMGQTLTEVTLHEVPKFTPWGLIYCLLERYGEVHQVRIRETNMEIPTTTGTYTVLMSLTKSGFLDVPDTLLVTEPSSLTEDIKISISIKGRKPRCWICHREGHLARDCPLRTQGQRAGPPNRFSANRASNKSAPSPKFINSEDSEAPSAKSKVPAVTETAPKHQSSDSEEEQGFTTVTRKKGGKTTPAPISEVQIPINTAPVEDMDTKSSGKRAREESPPGEEEPNPATHKTLRPRSPTTKKKNKKSPQKIQEDIELNKLVAAIEGKALMPQNPESPQTKTTENPRVSYRKTERRDVEIKDRIEAINSKISSSKNVPAELQEITPNVQAMKSKEIDSASPSSTPSPSSTASTLISTPSSIPPPLIEACSPSEETAPPPPLIEVSNPSLTPDPAPDEGPPNPNSMNPNHKVYDTHENDYLPDFYSDRGIHTRRRFFLGNHVCEPNRFLIKNWPVREQFNLDELLKLDTVGGLSTGNPENFPKASLLMTVISDNEKLNDMLDEAKEAFPFEVIRREGTRVHRNRCEVAYLHPSLYRACKMVFPQYVGSFFDSLEEAESDDKPLRNSVGRLLEEHFTSTGEV